jgi:hypothetical protein
MAEELSLIHLRISTGPCYILMGVAEAWGWPGHRSPPPGSASALGMSNGRENASLLSGSRHLEKTLNINGMMHYLLLLSLKINENQLNFKKKLH